MTQSAANPVDEHQLQAEYERLRADNRNRLKRRVATLGVVLIVAAGVEWRREIGTSLAGRWYSRGPAPRISPAEAAAAIASGNAMIIDVRDPAEFEVSHLYGAHSLPLSQLKADGWPENWPRTRPIIVYCTVGYRSGVAAGLLNEMGLEARNLTGGILSLAHNGFELVNESGATCDVHTWSERYAWLVPQDHHAVWEPGPRK